MEILKDFGVNFPLLVAQIVNFLIVFFILKKILYKPFLTILKKREENLKEGLKQAEEGRKILEEATKKEREMLKKAQDTSEKLVKNARDQAAEAAEKIEESAKKQSDKILADARKKIEQEVQESEEKLTREIGIVAVAILEKTLTQVLDRREKSEIIKQVSSRLKV